MIANGTERTEAIKRTLRRREKNGRNGRKGANEEERGSEGGFPRLGQVTEGVPDHVAKEGAPVGSADAPADEGIVHESLEGGGKITAESGVEDQLVSLGVDFDERK